MQPECCADMCHFHLVNGQHEVCVSLHCWFIGIPCSTYTCNGQTSSQFVPADTTVAYFNERGMSCTYPTGIATPANCVYKFVTPAAIAAAQYYFDCPSLNGAELENQLTTPCDLQGSHWEQRIFSQEVRVLTIVHALFLLTTRTSVQVLIGTTGSPSNEATEYSRMCIVAFLNDCPSGLTSPSYHDVAGTSPSSTCIACS